MLIFLNPYAAKTTRNLIFAGKQNSLGDKVQLVSSALSEMQPLEEEQARTAIEQMGSLNATRVLVTDEDGSVIYDTLDTDSAQGKYALLPEIIQALEGNDVFYSSYVDGTLESRAAVPMLHNNELVGSVYLMELDTTQGKLISALQYSIYWISWILEGTVILFSFIFSDLFSKRMRYIINSIRTIREGDYSHKMRVRGRDELAILAQEFNQLTDRLQTSESRRRQFVSDASHELKTPLTSIKLLSDSILQNDMDLGTIREFVGDIGNEADRLTRMSQKLLSLTKMDARKEEEREIVDICETVVKVQRMLKPVAQLGKIALENHARLGATVLVVEDDLYQILFNLVENGIKYNKPGGKLTVDLYREGEDHILTVTDNGVGIPDDSLPYIFDRFYRVDKARSREAGGSGLGLSIVHDMVRRNGGSISVSQVPEGGTCFTLHFPAFDLSEEDEP